MFYDVSFAFEQGQVLSILGANGAGKSTLLNLLAGELAPDAGAVETGETVRIGYFRQEVPDMDGDTRVIDYVKEIGSRIETGAGMLTASQLLEQFLFPAEVQWSPIRKLSGGEKQRVAICRALINDPELILADEPTGNLDSKSGDVVISTMTEINKELGKTIVMVTHDPKMASYCSRLILLKDGVILEDLKKEGDQEEFYQKILVKMKEL